ncbi:MAG: SRPBCC domain-containing protein [Halioglobus sp.]
MITEDRVSSQEVVISAPIELVWSVLVDFGRYADWNGFCPHAEATLALNEPIRMQVDLGFGLQEQVETICRIEPPTAIAWRMANEPGDPIHAVRTQTLEKLGDARCSYLSVDRFSGPGVPDMMAALGQAVEDGFNRCARDLKRHCEALYRAR